MSYKWEKADTAKGRERLFEILKVNGHVGFRRIDLGIFDFVRRDGTEIFCSLIDQEDNIHAYEIDEYIAKHGVNVEFLDPNPQNEIVIHPTTENHGDAGWIAYSALLPATVAQGTTEEEALQELQKSINALERFAEQPRGESNDTFDPKKLPPPIIHGPWTYKPYQPTRKPETDWPGLGRFTD